MSEKLVGYIVVGVNDLYALEVQHDGSVCLLQCHDRVTTFGTRQAARNAINRTKRYAKRNKLSWGWGNDYPIVALIPEAQPLK